MQTHSIKIYNFFQKIIIIHKLSTNKKVAVTSNWIYLKHIFKQFFHILLRDNTFLGGILP